MDCDEAFWKLTSKPHTEGDEAELELLIHLAVCPSCEQIAEALRPALNLHHESLPRREQRSLPVFQSARVKSSVQPFPSREIYTTENRCFSNTESNDQILVEYEIDCEIEEELPVETWDGATRVALFVTLLAAGGMTIGWWVC